LFLTRILGENRRKEKSSPSLCLMAGQHWPPREAKTLFYLHVKLIYSITLVFSSNIFCLNWVPYLRLLLNYRIFFYFMNFFSFNYLSLYHFIFIYFLFIYLFIIIIIIIIIIIEPIFISSSYVSGDMLIK
jgi:hypothetical protein